LHPGWHAIDALRLRGLLLFLVRCSTMMGHGGWFMGGGTWLFWIALLVIVLLAARWAVSSAGRRAGDRTKGPDAGAPSPELILKERYARGELTREEYQEKLRELRS
jgi:putative membrane protein